MWKPIAIGSIVGGVIVFIWGAISWMLLPWHLTSMQQFRSEWVMSKTIALSAPKSGIYILPNVYTHEAGLSKEDLKKHIQEGKEKMKNGPLVFASVQLEGKDFESPAPYIGSLIIQIVGAFGISWLLSQTRQLSYFKKVGFVTAIGLIAGILAYLPTINWWGFPVGYVTVQMLDLIIGWFLAGLALAKIVPTRA